ncbi:sulfatase [Thermophagus sp. OGC60D27]|uniref:sulfatase n=1 Tax=Thermophagus sp. OGC60D27 TaxID=3458415 RepID=UPI004037EE27
MDFSKTGRKGFLIIGGLFIGMLFSKCSSIGEETEKKVITFDEKTNIVLIAVDDMNNWVGALGGNAKTPNIDQLAKEGRLFTNSHCVVPACNPSRVALFSGMRPETTGQYTNQGNFRERQGGEDIITLPQRLRQEGYVAVAAGKLFHHPRGTKEEPAELSDDMSWDFQWKGNVGTPGHKLFLNEDGFASWLEGAEKPFVEGEYQNSGMKYICRFGVWGGIPQAKEACGDWKIAEFGADFLKKDHKNPFFLGLGFFRPHSPQIVPQEFIDMYPLDEIELPELPEDDMRDIPEAGQVNWSSPFVKLVKEKGQLKKAVQGYLASCSFADACIGQFMGALDNSPYKDNTIVILVTDHGFQTGHKNRWEKFSLWRQATQIPMIIRLPENTIQPGETDVAVSILDIYPTVLDLLDLDIPKSMEGHSLEPLLINPKASRKQPAIITWEQGSHSVVLDNWNYIHYQNGEEELYDRNADPDEFINLAGKPEYRELMDELKTWLPQESIPQNKKNQS